MTKRRNKKEEIEEIIDDETIEVIEEENGEYENISIEDRIYNIEKKTNVMYILVILISIISILTLISNFALNNSNSNSTSTNNTQKESEESYTYDTSNFKEITASEIKSESKNSTIVVLIGRQGCSHCAEFAPTIAQVAKEYNITVRYIDFGKIVDFTTNPEQASVSDSEAYNLIRNLEGKDTWSGFGETAMRGTPNTLIIKNNIIIGGINGNRSADLVREAFNNAGLKK